MNHEYIGYGVRTDNVKWKENIYSLLYEMIGETHSSLNEMIEEDFKENGEGFSSPKTFFKNFCQNYEKHSMKSGWEMVLSDFINEQEFPKGKEYFTHENWVLHVPLFIPKNEEEKSFCPSISSINHIFNKYLSPLSKNDLKPGYYDIWPD